ncbi:hypothetical protein NDU88_000705 [Pleurodeles waltl]|uniref:Uncharacterized protein n=1 Tax=Pleurodeles waltl TaxID=8319 RepID=A0AAV7P1S6_PLEWA|nr:hypothetical protein NDU88_000705 [Pleurodeles waltl]
MLPPPQGSSLPRTCPCRCRLQSSPLWSSPRPPSHWSSLTRWYGPPGPCEMQLPPAPMPPLLRLMMLMHTCTERQTKRGGERNKDNFECMDSRYRRRTLQTQMPPALRRALGVRYAIPGTCPTRLEMTAVHIDDTGPGMAVLAHH